MEMCVLGFSGGRRMKVLICLAIIMALWLFGVGQLHGMKVNVFMNVDVIHNISILVCVCVWVLRYVLVSTSGRGVKVSLHVAMMMDL